MILLCSLATLTFLILIIIFIIQISSIFERPLEEYHTTSVEDYSSDKLELSDFFLTVIPDESEVVHFEYYKYYTATDIYLELKFYSTEDYSLYLDKARTNADLVTHTSLKYVESSEKSIELTNPYDSAYKDIFYATGYSTGSLSTFSMLQNRGDNIEDWDAFNGYLVFSEEDYTSEFHSNLYEEYWAQYYCISYSEENLTVIITMCEIGLPVKLLDDYIPMYFRKFGIQLGEHDFRYFVLESDVIGKDD